MGVAVKGPDSDWKIMSNLVNRTPGIMKFPTDAYISTNLNRNTRLLVSKVDRGTVGGKLAEQKWLEAPIAQQ